MAKYATANIEHTSADSQSVSTKSTYKNLSASALVKTGAGEVEGIVVNSHTGGTLVLNDGITATTVGAKATQKLTSTGAMVPAKHAVSRLTSSGACVPAVHATSKITASSVVEGNTITLGDVIYVAKKVANVSAPYHVSMGDGDGTDAEFLDNFKLAVNGTGVAGLNYGSGTVAHPDVIATTNTDTTQVVVARHVGVTAETARINALPTTGVSVKLVWEDTTLGGGTGDSNAAVATNAATFTIGTKVYTAVTELSETSGATAVANQVLWETSEAVFLDNVKLAVNETNDSGQKGTKYSTGTVAHTDVIATTNAATYQVFMARAVGNDAFTTAINALATTNTLANYAWEGSTFGVGTGNSTTAVATTAATITIGSNVYTIVNELSETSGATAIVNQVWYNGSVQNALSNMKLALNAGATVGTNYSTGTITQTQVEGTTLSATELTVQALAVGTSYNSIATTETLANATWGAATLAGGVDTAPLMFNTITLPATSGITTFDRFINLGGASFTNGLYVTIGGTADITVLYR